MCDFIHSCKLFFLFILGFTLDTSSWRNGWWYCKLTLHAWLSENQTRYLFLNYCMEMVVNKLYRDSFSHITFNQINLTSITMNCFHYNIIFSPSLAFLPIDTCHCVYAIIIINKKLNSLVSLILGGIWNIKTRSSPGLSLFCVIL